MNKQFWPPNRTALQRAHSQLNAAHQHIKIGSPDLAIPRIKSAQNLLAFFLACHPEPLPKGPDDVS